MNEISKKKEKKSINNLGKIIKNENVTSNKKEKFDLQYNSHQEKLKIEFQEEKWGMSLGIDLILSLNQRW